MQLDMYNSTNANLRVLGTQFLDGKGTVSAAPVDLKAHSGGSGGTFKKSGGEGLWGLVVYSTPDPALNLVIWTPMPADVDSANQCWVSLGRFHSMRIDTYYLSRSGSFPPLELLTSSWQRIVPRTRT